MIHVQLAWRSAGRDWFCRPVDARPASREGALCAPVDSPSNAARQQWLERVDLALRTLGLHGAARVALQALAEGVEDASVLNLAASSHYREGRFAEAVQALERARVLAPRDPNVLNSLGVCLRAVGRTTEAVRVYDAALEIDPNMAPVHFNRGSALNEQSDINAARIAYERAAELDRNYVEPLAALASLDAKMGDPNRRGRVRCARSPLRLATCRRGSRLRQPICSRATW